MKNIMRKAIAIMLTLVMVICMENVNFASAATQPTKQSWEDTMVVGDTATFTNQDSKSYTITWKSNNTSVAAVEKKSGLVTAVKAGKAKITATLVKNKKKVTLSGDVNVIEAQSIEIKTQYGNVKGLKKDKNVTWYGIPYGAEPVGELRWSEPLNPISWSNTLDCSSKEAVALQYSSSSKSVIGSTNCLNLDVYTTNAKGSDLPVFVFFHGGNNQTGSSFGDLTGTSMVFNEECIIVDVNYRLGLLGFNCLPALQTEADSTGNYGFLDMQKSLQWVKNNIKEFGGDPSNVTVSGHSAGGRDVMAMLISPIFKDLFQKAIISSGGMTLSDEDQSASQIASFLAPKALKDGKASTLEKAQAWLLTSGSDVKEYLYSLTSEELMATVGDAGIRMSAFPHLYADGVSIPKSGFVTTIYNDVPIIMITGSDEFSFFNNGSAYSDGNISKEELAAAKGFGNNYGSQMYGYFNACASAQSMVYYGYRSPIYLMDCNLGHDSTVWPDMPLGAFHGVILGLMDSTNVFRYYFPTAYATEGASQMGVLANGYIKNFLWSKKGNPNSSDRTNWTKYTSASSQWLVLDATRDAASSTMKDIDVTSYEQVFKAMISDTTISDSAKLAVIRTVLNGRWFSSALDRKYNNINLWK